MLDLVIIGAGWSGLYAGRYASKYGMRFAILERREDLGGVWNFTEDPSVVTTMTTTVSSSSTAITEASDFAMPEEIGHFFHHTEAFEYLKRYAEHFGITPHIRFGADVVETRRDEDGWTVCFKVESDDGCSRIETLRARRLAICVGVNNIKREAGAPIADFAGDLIHAGDIKSFDSWSLSADDHVVVYGGGETSADLVDELVKTPAKITWAIRGGQHFYRRTAVDERLPAGVFERQTSALDLNTTPMHRGLSYFPHCQPGVRALTNLLCTGSLFGYQGHGIPAWANATAMGHAFFNKSGHTVEHVRAGRVRAEAAIVDVEGHRIAFESGQCIEATHLIYCFGYRPDFSFLPAEYQPLDLARLYQLIFYPRDPSLVFFGFARPTWFSIPFMTELQCGYAFKVFSGRLSLPEKSEMIREADRDFEVRRKQFPSARLTTLVDPMQYYERFVALEGNPVFTLRRILRKPILSFKLLTVPLTPRFSRFRDSDDDTGIDRLTVPIVGRALRFLDRNNVFLFVVLALLIIPPLRLIRFDAIVDKIARRRLARGEMIGFKGADGA